MRVQTISGRGWTVRALSETQDCVWVHVVAQTPEQALASFRDQYPGHNVKACMESDCTAVVVPA